MQKNLILYSFRRCPYAIRTRMALRVAGIAYEHREVLLKDKPADLVRVSPKATVPVLVFEAPVTQAPPLQVFDESIDIMHWALAQHDPESWLAGDPGTQDNIDDWVATFEANFKPNLDAYKYGNDRTTEAAEQQTLARRCCEQVLAELNNRLKTNTASQSNYLFGEQLGFADVAVFPFIRQYAAVDRDRFNALQLTHLTNWLDRWLKDRRFLDVMEKHPRWQAAL